MYCSLSSMFTRYSHVAYMPCKGSLSGSIYLSAPQRTKLPKLRYIA